MTVSLIWTLHDWASAVEVLPGSPGPLPERRVVVPNSRVAHCLRRELIERGSAQALIGTRFLTPLQLARELLLDGGEPNIEPNDTDLGPTLLDEAFTQVDLQRFTHDDLLSLPGWDLAFCRTVRELDEVQLAPEVLAAHADPHIADVGRIHALLRERGELVTPATILQRASKRATTSADRIPTLTVLGGFESPAELQLLRALKAVTWARWAVRPSRTEHTQRVTALCGQAFHAAHSDRSKTASNALGHLQLRLFEDGVGAAAPDDDSVRIAIYSGVHEEVEAAVSWVAEQILQHGVPAQQIAILSAAAEPYGSLLRGRLAMFAPATDVVASYSERGVPLTERPDGTRLLLAVRALSEGLARDALAPLLPLFRVSEGQHGIKGLSHAWEILNTVAAVGGDPTNLAGGCSWPAAWTQAATRLETTPPKTNGLEEREQLRRSRLQEALAVTTPAIAALTDLLRAVVSDAPLRALQARFTEFARAHLWLPFARPAALDVLSDTSVRFANHETREPHGADALRWLEAALCEERVVLGRFGDPAVYLGTLAGARGLSFRAVRIVGLVEGSVPGAAREDAVLPDAARVSLSPFLLTSAQRAHQQLSAFDDAIRAARERLVLTAPRVTFEGSVRQPAAVLLDVTRALTGKNANLEQKLEAAASTGRDHERRFRAANPLSASTELDRIARGDLALAKVDRNPALSLDALRGLRDRTAATSQDGLLGGVLAPERIAGLNPASPISPSRLRTLLSCPHHYLYENVLNLREAAGPLPTHSLEPMTFGTWLHAIAEEFWREHGAKLGRRKGELADHASALRAHARERFEALRQTYPFANEVVAHAACEALCDQLDKLLQIDWNGGKPRTFVDVEREFGYGDVPCSLDTESGPLHVRGKIDKLDRDGDSLLVRDIKTGKGKPRKGDAAPDLDIDLQLAVYALVAARMANVWRTPERVGVAYLYLRSGQSDRSWIGADYAQLEQAAEEWLAAARDALQAASFVRSPDPEDCTYCPHKPICKPELTRAGDVLEDERVPRRLAQLKRIDTGRT